MCFIRDQSNITFNYAGFYRFRFRFSPRFSPHRRFHIPPLLHPSLPLSFLYSYHWQGGFSRLRWPKQTPPLEKLSLAGRHYLCSSWFDVQGPAFHHHTSRAIGLERSTSSTLYSFWGARPRDSQLCSTFPVVDLGPHTSPIRTFQVMAHFADVPDWKDHIHPVRLAIFLLSIEGLRFSLLPLVGGFRWTAHRKWDPSPFTSRDGWKWDHWDVGLSCVKWVKGANLAEL